MFFSEVYRPRLGDFTAEGLLSTEAALQLMEDLSTHHMMSVRDSLVTNGAAWVLAEWRLVFTKRPKYFEPVQLTTWARGKAPASMTYRDFLATGEDGEEFFRASSKFALLDLETQKMVKITEELMRSYAPEEKTAFPDSLLHLNLPQSAEEERELTLRRSDFDFNGHVHNTRYMDFALDNLPEGIKETDFDQIRIVYRAPLRPGTPAAIRRSETASGQLFSIHAGGKVCAIIDLKK